MRKVAVFIEGQRLDLFEDERINLNRSVQDIKDISKIYTDFTQTFNVPASKNNQKIFRHFEIPEIDNGFDTRIKKDGSITINTLDFVKGKIRLEDVQLKNNRPASFSITFFGDLVSLKDLVGEDKLNTLDWLSQYDHDYTPENIKLGLEDAISFEGEKVIRYPFLSPVRRWIYQSEALNMETASVLNPGFYWSEVKPSIGLHYIMQAIQEKYGITFSGDFFKRNEFKTMQLWLSPDKGYMKASGRATIPLPNGIFTNTNTFFGTVSGLRDGEAGRNSFYSYTLSITPTTDAKYSITIEDNGVPVRQLTDLSGPQDIIGKIQEYQPNTTRNFSLKYYVSSEEAFTYDAVFDILYSEWNDGYQVTSDTLVMNNENINGTVKILEQMPDITILEFLQGLFKMFNLTVVPVNGSLDINNLEEWYNNGRIIDISQYVDDTAVDIEKGTILKQIDLKFAEGGSFLLSEFIKNAGRSYGDLEYILRDSEGRKLDGETLKIDLPFEQLIYERLPNLDTAALTNVQYGYVVDEDQEPHKIAPHLFYIVNQEVDVKMIDKDDVSVPLTNLNTPSHIGQGDLSQYSTTFSADYEEFSGNAITSNLLTNYYLDYLTDIFSSKRRVFHFKAKFPGNIIRDLKLNDRLIIKGRRYIINTMDLGLNKGDASLELINDIYKGETQESLTTKILLSAYFAEFNKQANNGSFTYQTNEEVNYVTSIDVVDLGSGTAWISQVMTGNLIEYSLTQNTGEERYAAIKITGFSGSVTYYKIKQDA